VGRPRLFKRHKQELDKKVAEFAGFKYRHLQNRLL